MDAKSVVLAYWEAMNSNDFHQASTYLSIDFEGFWPQSNELICGRDNFSAINSAYPSNGQWSFIINSLVCEVERVVTDVSVSDGVQKERAITFHTVKNGLITRQTEFWPDAMEPQPWRSDWVTITES
ncbi:nuclear transport factor 2 family protein [Vibrio sp. Of14-4]|uniref:nuclear transport factor 2 family protein n=1 Tax=Vibrio sp. Of14-4 TaxID=2724878 RepID=UPI001EF31AB2|nr:nuclear transport factor 2 family protein [Vibrio sp. Of14-4]MCG7488229.1 nuclear transport factor 2 family protein [Vibrio sp. Of14-4]